MVGPSHVLAIVIGVGRFPPVTLFPAPFYSVTQRAD